MANSIGIGHFCINILNLIFKECPEGIVYKDKNLRYLTANPAFASYSGYQTIQIF